MFKSLNNSAFRLIISPLAIKSFKFPSLFKYNSTSDINFPFLILLLIKLLKFEGLII